MNKEYRLELFLDKKGGLREDFFCISRLEDVRNKYPYTHCTCQQETETKRQLTSLMSLLMGDFLLHTSEQPRKICEAKEGLPISENKFQKFNFKKGMDRLLKLRNQITKPERRF